MSQDHHLIPNAIYNDAIRFLNSIGYTQAAQDAQSNLVSLPSSLESATLSHAHALVISPAIAIYYLQN
jgi:hypothetical protein